MTKPEEAPANSGGRNLAIFGIVSILIAIVASGVSLFIYSASGDIYLDRSRPGFIFDEEEEDDKTPPTEDIDFSADGDIDESTLKDYLKQFDSVYEKIQNYSDGGAFPAEDLSDEGLNIVISPEAE